MKKEKLEMLAFFYLCKKRDRNLLQGKVRMTCSEFIRFDYLTRRLEFWEYNKRIWTEFSGQFEKELEREKYGLKEEWELDEEIRQRESWWAELTKNCEDLLDLEGNYC